MYLFEWVKKKKLPKIGSFSKDLNRFVLIGFSGYWYCKDVDKI